MPASDASNACSDLVAALVEWGATASQIVTHMERSQRASSAVADSSTVQTFQRLISEVIAPVAAGRPNEEIRRTAGLVAAIDHAVREEIILVPLARTPLHGRRGRRG